MACYDLLFEAFLQEENVQLMKRKCHELRDHLHARKDDMKEVFEEVSSILLKLFDATLEQELSEMAHFLRSYMKQVESLLHLIRASRQGEWKLHLGALEENVTMHLLYISYNVLLYHDSVLYLMPVMLLLCFLLSFAMSRIQSYCYIFHRVLCHAVTLNFNLLNIYPRDYST